MIIYRLPSFNQPELLEKFDWQGKFVIGSRFKSEDNVIKIDLLLLNSGYFTLRFHISEFHIHILSNQLLQNYNK